MKSFLFPVSIMVVFAVVGVFAVNPFHSSLANDTCRHGLFYDLYQNSAQELTKFFPHISNKEVQAAPKFLGKTSSQKRFAMGPDDISGKVWEDWNFNGAMDEVTIIGITGVEVQLFDCQENMVGSTISDASGDFILDNGNTTFSGNANEVYRLEFIIPNDISAWAKPTQTGTENGTSVQFVQKGDTAYLGLAAPADFCQNNPNLVTNCFIEGDNSGTGDVLLSYTSQSPAVFKHETVANQIGTTYGLAFQRASNTLFASAYMKRFAGLVGSTGSIFKISNPDDGVLSGEEFVDLNDLFGSDITGTDPHNFVDKTLFGDVIDSASYSAVSKMSFGDLDISGDERSLWTVNLFDRSLYQIPLGDDPADPNPPTNSSEITIVPLTDGDIAVPNPLPDLPTGITDNEIRPFALEIKNNLVYVGLVTSGEDGGSMYGLVYAYDPANLTFTKVLEFPLGYDRGCALANTTLCIGPADWNPWTDTYPTTPAMDAGAEHAHPQPILSDIEFDANGNMVIGLRDRFGDQTGYKVPRPNGNINLRTGDGFGDILLATLTGANSWTLDTTQFADHTYSIHANGTTETELFFGGDYYIGANDLHEETGSGGLVILPGQNVVISTVIDPIASFSAGVDWFNTNTGAHFFTLELLDRFEQFSKANGLGEMEVICDPAPIEIGNLVWEDLDGDGAQDACEPGLSGVNVHLYDKLGNLLASTMTDGNGQYYFSHSDSTDQVWISSPDSVEANTVYYIVVGTGQFSNGQLDYNGDDYSLTVDSTDSGANRFAKDSDGTIAQYISNDINGLPFVKVTTNDWGASDHSLDFGFYDCLPEVMVLDEIICEGSTYFFNNQNLAASGTYYDSLLTVDGCDSVFVLNLVVQPVTDVQLTEEICPGESYPFFGNNLTTTGIYRDTQFYTSGCDSIRTTLDLTALADCSPPVFDLALRKKLAPTQSRYVQIGEYVKFRIYVFNQGDFDAFNVLVVDYQPIGFDFSLSQSPGWFNFGAGPTWFLPSLPAGSMDSIDITFLVNSNAAGVELNNYAEITSADDDLNPSNADPVDHDSTPNGLFYDDPGGTPGTPADNVITGDGTGVLGSNDPLTDEDDHDGEEVILTAPILSLGNLVFEDFDNDGVFNNSDQGIEDVEVELYEAGLDGAKNTADDVFIASTLTNGFGEYLFTGLVDGLYYVKLTGVGIPVGHRSSTGGGPFDNDGSGTVEPAASPDDDVDDVDDGTQMITMIVSGLIQLSLNDEPGGNQNLTLDFGIYAPQPESLGLGNLVFNDKNNDGIFNNNDEGIEDVEVQLFDLGTDGIKGTTDDNLIAATVTNGFGEYQFSTLPEGTYYVQLTGVGIPAGYVSSTGDGVTDMDGMGFYEPATGTDNNVDGTDDGTQMGDSIMSETIVLIFDTEINDGDDNSYNNPSVDFGLYLPEAAPTVSVGDLVFWDKTNNGVFDGSDEGLENVEVVLYSPGTDGLAGTPDDLPLKTTMTNGFGQYLFDTLSEGSYFIKLSGGGIPAGYISSTGDGIYDSDTLGFYEPALNANGNTDNVDDGTQMGSMILSSVFQLSLGDETGDGDSDPDYNQSLDFGLYEPQEPPVFDLALRKTLAIGQSELVNIGDVVTFTVTIFNQGTAPAYNILVLDYLPIGFTFNAAGSPGWFNFGAGPTWFYAGPLLPGQADSLNIQMTVNNMALPGMLNNYAEITSADDNTNGSDTPPTDIDSTPDAFLGNDAGGTPGLPADNALDGDGTGAFNSNNPLTDEDDMDGAEVHLDVPTMTLGNLVFADYENDGVFNNSDEGINNVRLELYEVGNDGEKGTADDEYVDFSVTDSVRKYLFQIYAEGLYYVKLTGDGIPTNYVSSTGEGVNDPQPDGPFEPATGTDDNVDDTDDGSQMGAMVMSDTIRMTFGNEPLGAENNDNPTVDFGLYEPIIFEILDLGNLVFHDENNDGVFNNSEPGLEAVEVKLFDVGPDGEQGTMDDVEVATTQTDSVGIYQFTGINPGTYYVILTGVGIPVDMVSSTGEGIYDNDGAGPFEPSLGTNNDLNNLDDGTQMGAMILSDTIRLTFGGEPDFDVNNTVDFGLYAPTPEPTMTLGNLVFADVQNNGFFNGADYGIADVEVQLMNLGPDEIKGTNDDELLLSTTTNGSGEYQFAGIPQGLYYVKLSGFGIPTNWVSSTGQGIYDNDGAGPFEPSIGTNNNFNNVDDGTQMDSMIMSDTIRLTWFQEPQIHVNNTVDFGLYEPRIIQLGNLVFNDLDNDGIFNNSDQGIEDVEVALMTLGPDGEKGTNDDVQLSTQMTNGFGEYLFTGMVEGLYYVKLTGNGIPMDFVSSTGDGVYDMDGAGAYEPSLGTDANVDGIDDGTQMGSMIMSDTIRLTLDGEPDRDANYTVDFGLYFPQDEPTFSLGNLVFHDLDNDGVFNNADVGLQNVEVVLFDVGLDGEKGTGDDIEIATKTTNAAGEYLFTGFHEGLYYVQLSGTGIPANFVSSTGDGIYDMDGSGPFEPSLGTDDNTDHIDDGSQMGMLIMSDTIRLTIGGEPGGEVNTTVDFGLYEPQIANILSLGNLVFHDQDNDGLFNNADEGIENVEVKLFEVGVDGEKGTMDDLEIDTKTTNVNGEYLFENLIEGLYYVKLSGVGIPANFISSTGDGIYDMDGDGPFEPSLGTDGNSDDIDDGTQMSDMVMSDTIRLTLYSEPNGNENLTVDFGLYEPQPVPTVSVGNLVFTDYDNDGVFNNIDMGIEGVEVEIYDLGTDGIKGTNDDNLLATDTTNNVGEYQFFGLDEGVYYLKLNGNGIPANYVSSTGDGPYDMDGAGAFEPSTGTDNNLDGIDDGTQMGAMIMSDTIRLTLGNEPDGDVNNTVDFGLYEPQIQPSLSLGNLVFEDFDNDGSFNNSDVGLAGVELVLINVGPDNTKGTTDDFNVDTLLTNGAGQYLFTNIYEPGVFCVKLTGNGIPAGYLSSTGDGPYDADMAGAYEPFFGTNNNIDNDDDGTAIMMNMILSDTIRLSFGDEPDGDVNTTVDFGLYHPQTPPIMSLGNLVFHDKNNDGVFNQNDAGLQGVEVALYQLGTDGIKGTADDALIATENTNNLGGYLFTDLFEGLYYVKLTGVGVPIGYISSTGDGPFDMDGAGAFEPSTGTDNNIDEDDDGTQMGAMIMSDTIRLVIGDEPGGDVNTTVDFGLYEPQELSLGNLVFHDLDNDGVFNNVDTGLAGIEVKLFDLGVDSLMDTNDDNELATLFTNSNGEYVFTGLENGIYYVKLTGVGIPFGFESSTGEGPYDLDSIGPFEPTSGTDNNVDGIDDGTQMGAMILSDTIRLTLQNEPNGNNNYTVDFGLFAPHTPPVMHLGSQVFHDLNNDGLFAFPDTGLADVKVELYDLGTDGIKGTTDDNLIASQTTNSFGGYLFLDLFEGLYYVKLSGEGIPPNFVSSTGDGIYDQDGSGPYEPYFGTDNDIDKEDDGTQMGAMIMSDTIRLVYLNEPLGNVNLTVDFGLYEPQDEPTNSLGNLVFNDFENDGIFNNNDIGLQGVEVELYQVGVDGQQGTGDDIFIGTKSTDNNGEYLFTGLPQGLYYVKLNGNGIPANHVSSTGEGIFDQDGAGPFEPITGSDNNIDNQDDGSQMGAMILSDTIRLSWFQEPEIHENRTVDFGLYEPQDVPTLSLGNLVFDDRDNDGIFNNNDVGLADVEVKLFDVGPDSLANTMDDIELTTKLTSGQGNYLFTGLSEGLYYVKLSGVGIPTGYVSSTGDGAFDKDGNGPFEPIFGTDNNVDHQDDGSLIGGVVQSDTIRLALDDEPDVNVNTTVDFGLYMPLEYASVGDQIWFDDDRDGQQGANPAGISGVFLELLDLGTDGIKGTADDNLIDVQETDGTGNYSFTGLVPGDYYIMINLTTIPTDHELTVQDQGADETDSDFNAMGMTEVFTLGSGEDNTTVDAGIVPKPSSIGNFVWFDNDHNGQQDIGEPGIPQLPVQLFDLGMDGMKGGGDDNLVSSTNTDDNGFYLFDGLEAGSYYVQFDISAYATTYTATPQDIGDDATDSDGNAIGMTDVIVLAIGEENLSIDFGLEPKLATLGDYVWFDTNHNGQQDANETGVPDFHISIFNLGIDGVKNTGDDMLVGETMTLADGSYSFPFLQPGSYYLIFDVNPYVGMYSAAPQNIGNDATDSDGNGGGMTDVIVLSPAEINNAIDFGLEPDHAMLGDFVWYDNNVNGQQDIGEMGVPNVLIRLFNLGSDGQKGGGDDLEFNAVLTDSTGYYLFNFLEPDQYYVQFELSSLPTDYFPTTPNSGDDTTDSDANQMGMTEVVTLGPGENNATLDMGVYNPMFDLSLTKSLASGQSSMVDINQTIHYQITVKNEGLTDAYNVLVADHIPAGLLFSPINMGWVLENDSTATYNIAGPILPNDEVVLDIYLIVQYGASGASLVNVAEVESATDVNGVVVNDIDSTPANENPAEDDIDEEEIVLLDHDPTGWIYCEKTGQVITGGTITVIGPNGIPNAEVQIIADGSAGYYEFYAVGATGTYTIHYAHPSGFPFSVDCPPGGVFNPVNGGPAVTLGSLASNGYLLDTACVANPYYFQFELELGDPPIFANNIPVQCAYISSIVCEDSNNNDMVDPADLRIVGATVNLYDCNDPNNILATSITDADGRYEFDGLTPGDYMVGYQLPTGTRFVSNGTMNTNGFSNCVSLNWGECDTTKLICLYTCPAVTADDQTICFGGMAQLSATVPYGNGSFNWLPPNDLSATNIPNPVASPADTTTYMVTYMDGLGCLVSDDATVFVLNTSPYLTYTPFDSISVECDQPVPFEAPVFADDCDANLLVTLDSMVLAPGCGLTIERTWTATNAQGNAITFTQIVHVVDNTPPVMMANHPLFGNIFHGDTLYANCTNIPSLDSLGFSAFDYCCATTVTFEESVTIGDCDVDGFVESRYCGWTASDCCGNTDSLFFTIIVQDMTGPVLTGVPADVTVDCENVPAIAIVTAEDACSGSTPVVFSETVIGDSTSGCFYLRRTWTATDSCGNTTSDSQGILVQDFVPPVLFNVPPSGVADCENIPDAMVTAIDNCDGDIPVTLTETLTTDSNGCVLLVERRWTAIDGCGNLSFATQMLVVENNDAPELTITHPMFVGRQHGDTIFVQCDQVAVLTANDATATADCCGAPTIEFHEYVSNGDCLEDGYLASMTCGWTATDCCGNTDSLFLHIIVIDNTPPVLKNVPANMMYQCVGTLPSPPNVTATDNCDDNAQVSYSETTEFVNNALQTTRTWTATDACGNTISQSQIITYTQENAPFILNVPADIDHANDRRYTAAFGKCDGC
ncbi:MAG: SdrD B-like domain-containing protein [Saprospiraceae bacterium]